MLALAGGRPVRTPGEELEMKGGGVFGTALAMVVAACGSDRGNPASKDDGMDGGCACIGVAPDTPQPVDWNAPTVTGKTAAEAFGGVSGTCTAPLTWDAKSADDLVVTPSTGSSSVTVEVTVDETSARVVQHHFGGGTGPPPTLMVDATVHVASEDGTFVADGTSTPGYPVVGRLDLFRLNVPVGEFGGTLSITPKDPKTAVELAFELAPIATGCRGDVWLVTTVGVGSDGGVSAANGRPSAAVQFARWSDTGAP
jgi:hypothetical protein